MLSGLQKSIRGSDPNAALYYLSLLAQSGDVESIERRLLVIAYEDIGLANPQLVSRTYAACQAAEHVGFPEAIIPFGVHIIDLCISPKWFIPISNIMAFSSFNLRIVNGTPI